MKKFCSFLILYCFSIFSINIMNPQIDTVDEVMISWGIFMGLNPDKNILQICENKGDIFTKNALLRASQKWKEKITVINIDGTLVIKDEICKKAYNYYVSKGDTVPAFSPESKTSNLDRHKDDRENFDQTITPYQKPLEGHIEDHLKKKDKK